MIVVVEGFLHPLIELPHLISWIALSILIAQNRPIETPSLCFAVLFTAIGYTLGSSIQVSLLSPVLITILCIVLPALLIIIGRQIKPTTLKITVIALSTLQGLTLVEEKTTDTELIFQLIGVTFAAYVTFTSLTAIFYAILTTKNWGKIVLRAIGSWIMAIGLLSLAITLV